MDAMTSLTDEPRSIRLQDVPPELILEILKKLAAPDLVRIGSVCKQFRQRTLCPSVDASLWELKLPSYCLASELSLDITKQRPSAEGHRIGLTQRLPSSHRDLACLVYAFTATLADVSSAEEALQQALPCWNAEQVVQADIALSRACALYPSLKTYAAYTSLLFHERAVLQRTVTVLCQAAMHIQTHQLLGLVHSALPPWRSGLDPEEGIHDLHAYSRQLASLIAILLRIETFSLASLQANLVPKYEVLRVGNVPPVFQDWLDGALPDSTLKNDTQPSPSTAPSSTPPREHTTNSEDASCSGPSDSTHVTTFEFLGTEYSRADLAAARRLMLRELHPLLKESDLEVLRSHISLEDIRGELAELMRDLIVRPVIKVNDMFCGFMWNHRAHMHMKHCYNPKSPHLTCKRIEAWSAVDCYLAALTLLKSKPSNNFRLLHVISDSSTLSENMQTACLAELTMQLHHLGWIEAAKHCCTWALVENEAGSASDIGRCRCELAGVLADMYSITLERSRSASDEEIAATVREAIIWALASAKLTPAGHSMLNDHFVNRLSKVLHCCVLRLPDWQQRERCAKAALALCRVGLKMYRGKYRQDVNDLPVPRVDFRPVALKRGEDGVANTDEDDGGWYDADDENNVATSSTATPPNDQPFRLLAIWHSEQHCQELTDVLVKDDISEITGTPATPHHKSTSGSKTMPSSSLHGRPSQEVGRKGSRALATDVSHLVDWLGNLRYIVDETSSADWEEYEDELADLLGMKDGRQAIQDLLSGADVELDSTPHWESICHIYEHMAHVCTAASCISMSALYYGLSARSLMQISPRQFQDQGLGFPRPVDSDDQATTPDLADMLSQQATELTSAGELTAAMSTLLLCESICKHQLQVELVNSQHGLDSEDDFFTISAQAMLARVKIQIGSTIMELKNRHGVSEVTIPKTRWPLKHHFSSVTSKMLTVEVSYASARRHVKEALDMSRDHHLDCHLQGLFVLGDLSLVMYDLKEAQRLFSIVAVASSHPKVQHYNLMLQALAFLAVSEMHIGNSNISRALIHQCMQTFGLSVDSLSQYSANDAEKMTSFSVSMGALSESHPFLDHLTGGLPSHLSLQSLETLHNHVTDTQAAIHPTDKRSRIEELVQKYRHEWTADEVAIHMPMLDRIRALPHLQPSTSTSAFPQNDDQDELLRMLIGRGGDSMNGAEGMDIDRNSGAGGAGPSKGPGTSSRKGGSRKAGAQHKQTELKFETLTEEEIEGIEHEDLLIRVLAAASHRKIHPRTVMKSIYLRAMEIQVLTAPEGREAEFVEEMQENWLENAPIPMSPYWRALQAMAHQLPQVPTSASALQRLKADRARCLLEMNDLPDLLPELPDPPGHHSDYDSEPDSDAMSLGYEEVFEPESNDTELWDYIKCADRPGQAATPSFASNAVLGDVLSPNHLTARTSGKAPISGSKQTDASTSEAGANAHDIQHTLNGHADVLISHQMLECEDAEWSAIKAFMNQVGLQMHLMQGQHERASIQAIRSMNIKARDQPSFVHLWYWSAAIAQHRGDWKHACLFFRRAATCTHHYTHLSMQAKCLVAGCEAVLSFLVHTNFNELLNTPFAAARGGRSPPRAAAQRCTLCRSLKAHLASVEDSSQAFLMTWTHEERNVKVALCRALMNAHSTDDQGVELRTLLVILFVLEMDGALVYDDEGRIVGDEHALIPWLVDARVGTLVKRARMLGSRLRRNVLVIRRLMGCRILLDPVTIWEMDTMSSAAGSQFSELDM